MSTSSFRRVYSVSNVRVVKKADIFTPSITVDLFLQSTIERRGFFAHLALNRMAVELVVKWPKALADLYMMHKKWITDLTVRYEKYHPKYSGLAECMKL